MATKTELIAELAELAGEIMSDLVCETPNGTPVELVDDFTRLFTQVIAETLSDEIDGIDGIAEHVAPIALGLLGEVGTDPYFPAYEFAERFVTKVAALPPSRRERT